MVVASAQHHTVTTVHAHPVTGQTLPCLVVHPADPFAYGTTRPLIRACGLAAVDEAPRALEDHDASVRLTDTVVEVVGGGVVRHTAVASPGWADLAADRGVILLTVGLDHPHDTRIADGRRGLGAWLRGSGQCFVGLVPVLPHTGDA